MPRILGIKEKSHVKSQLESVEDSDISQEMSSLGSRC